MKRKKTVYSIISLVLAAALSLTACSKQGGLVNVPGHVGTEGGSGQVKTMLSEARIEYDKVSMSPGILVDLVGYETDAEKIAVFEGDILPRSFSVVDNKTGEKIFHGVVEEKIEATEGTLACGIGDFSEIIEPGDYHIEAELLGYSKDFSISEGIYEKLLKEKFESLRALRFDDSTAEYVPLEDKPETRLEVSGGWTTGEGGQRDVAEGCLAIFDLIKAYDYFSDALDGVLLAEGSDKRSPIIDEIIYEANWLTKLQNRETGGVYTSVTLKKENENDAGKLVIVGETTRATAYYCAVMANLSYFLSKTEPELSKECLLNAVLAWNCLEANKELVTESQKFRAAVELYRATGNTAYKDALDEYLKVHADRDFEERLEIDGAMSYMSTSKNVNLDYCTTLMRHFMSKAERNAISSKEARYLVEDGVEDEATLLRDVSELVEADFILTSQEYYKIEINYLHYFCGRNPESGICTSFSENPDTYAQFMILLGNLLSK